MLGSFQGLCVCCFFFNFIFLRLFLLLVFLCLFVSSRSTINFCTGGILTSNFHGLLGLIVHGSFMLFSEWNQNHIWKGHVLCNASEFYLAHLASHESC